MKPIKKPNPKQVSEDEKQHIKNLKKANKEIKEMLKAEK